MLKDKRWSFRNLQIIFKILWKINFFFWKKRKMSYTVFKVGYEEV